MTSSFTGSGPTPALIQVEGMALTGLHLGVPWQHAKPWYYAVESDSDRYPEAHLKEEQDVTDPHIDPGSYLTAGLTLGTAVATVTGLWLA